MWTLRLGLITTVAGLLACSVAKEPVSLSPSDPSSSKAPEAAAAPHAPMLMSDGEAVRSASAEEGSGVGPHHHAHDHDGEGKDAGETTGAYTCSMHPEVNQSMAGSCSICSMPLVPKPATAQEAPRKEPQ